MEQIRVYWKRLVVDVGFNREVAQDAALYWSSSNGDLAELIDKTDLMIDTERTEFGIRAKQRINEAYSWKYIGEEYRRLWKE